MQQKPVNQNLSGAVLAKAQTLSSDTVKIDDPLVAHGLPEVVHAWASSST